MADQYTTLEYILYYMPLLLPLICLFAMPELVKEIVNFIWIQRTNVVAIGNAPNAAQRTPNMVAQ
jgi:hypothetical protein